MHLSAPDNPLTFHHSGNSTAADPYAGILADVDAPQVPGPALDGPQVQAAVVSDVALEDEKATAQHLHETRDLM